MYEVTFFDDTKFTGGDPHESKWDELPNKPIKSIVYWVTNSPKYSFTDFEEYCHCVERVQGVNINFAQVSKALIMGRVKHRVYIITFDLMTGLITQDCLPYGKEYHDRPLTGWKFGKILEEEEYPGPKLKRLE